MWHALVRKIAASTGLEKKSSNHLTKIKVRLARLIVDSLRTEGKSKRQMITVLVCRATLCGVDVQQEERRPLTEQSLRLLQSEKLWKPPTELHVDSVCHSGLHGKNRMTSTHHMSTALTLSYCPLITYCVVPRQMLAAPRANCSGNGHPRWMPSSSVETQTPSSHFLSW